MTLATLQTAGREVAYAEWGDPAAAALMTLQTVAAAIVVPTLARRLARAS